MAKKQGKSAVKKPARTVKSKSAAAKKSPTKKSTTKGRTSKKEEKYEQSGAPWWKMHLPE